MKIEDIEGIGPVLGGKLREAGIASAEALLAKAGPRAGRAELAEVTGIGVSTLLEWANRADLIRIKGVGSEFSDLLEAAGVDSPTELAHRNADNLAAKVQEVVAARPSIVRRVPRESMIEDWIEQSKGLSKVIEH